MNSYVYYFLQLFLKEIKAIMKTIETPERVLVTILQVIHHDPKIEQSNTIAKCFKQINNVACFSTFSMSKC